MALRTDVTVSGFSDTVAVPTGTAGDVVAVWAADGSASDVDPPDVSWTLRGQGSGGFAAFWLFTKTRTGSEGTDYQFTFTGAAGSQLLAANIEDCDTADPVANTSYNSGSGTTLTGTGVDADTDDSLLTLVAASITEGELDGPPTGMVEPETSTDHLKYYDQSVDTGATGNRTTTINSTQNWIAFMATFNNVAAGGVTATAALTAAAATLSSTVDVPVTATAALTAASPTVSSTVSVPVAIAAAALQAAAAVVSSTVSVLVTVDVALTAAAATVSATVGDVVVSTVRYVKRRRFGWFRRS